MNRWIWFARLRKRRRVLHRCFEKDNHAQTVHAKANRFIDRFIHMKNQIILASGSQIRATLLQNAGISFETKVPRIDEQTIKESLVSEGGKPRDIADALAEMKARKISGTDAFVVGCDQVLSLIHI